MSQMMVRGRDVFLLAGTRVALGVGVGLLWSRRLPKRTRERAGRALLAIGILTTIPLVRRLRGASGPSRGRLMEHAAPGPYAAPATTGMHSAF